MVMETDNTSNKNLEGTSNKPAAAPVTPVHAPHEGHIEPDLPRVRTYADDLSEEIKKKGSTLTTIVGAERERAARELALMDEPEEPAPQKTRNILLLVATIALIIVGVGVVGGALYYLQTGSGTQQAATPSIIFPNKTVRVDVGVNKKLSDTLAAARANSSLSLGEVERIDVTLVGATTTAQNILRQFDAPAALIREAQSVMIGIHSFDHTQPFIIIEVGQYDRAFSAMLGWEEDMGRGLGTFFKPAVGTTPPTTIFTDQVYRNVDARVSQAEWPILYAFPRRDILVITTNQYTLQEIMTRLSAQQTTSTQ